MRFSNTLILGLLAASCQTPPPAKPTLDDEVIVKQEPVEPATPDAGAAEPDVAAEPVAEPVGEPPPETFVAKPQLPNNMSFQETALARTAEQVRRGLIFAPVLEGGCGVPASIRASAEPSGAGYTVDSCTRAVDAVHALTYERTLTKLGVLDVSPVAIRHDGEIIWSAAVDCTNLRQRDNACGSDFSTRQPAAKSFVGPVLSYQLVTTSASAGGAPSTETTGFVIDVRTGLLASFGLLIDEDSLLNGLKRDLFMRRTLNPQQLDAAKSVDEIWKLWRTQDFAFFGAYYFSAWDAENGLAQMQIWYLEDRGEASELKLLPIWVSPAPQWKTAFEEAASAGSGFLAR